MCLHAMFALSSMKVSHVSHQIVMRNAKVRATQEGYSCNNSHEAKRYPWNGNVVPRAPPAAAHCAHASQPHSFPEAPCTWDHVGFVLTDEKVCQKTLFPKQSAFSS